MARAPHPAKRHPLPAGGAREQDVPPRLRLAWYRNASSDCGRACQPTPASTAAAAGGAGGPLGGGKRRYFARKLAPM